MREGLSVVYEDQEGENRNTSMIGKHLEDQARKAIVDGVPVGQPQDFTGYQSKPDKDPLLLSSS